MYRVLGCMLMVVLLSGCSGGKSGGDSDSGSSMTTSVTSSTATTAPPATAALPPKEVYNNTLTFASASGGSAGSGTFEVPKGYGNLTVILTSTAQCPGYAKQAAVEVAAGGGLDESLPVPFIAFLQDSPVSDVGGYEPSSCSAADLAGNRTGVATSTTNRAVQPGAGTLQAAGEFTGSVRIAVVALP